MKIITTLLLFLSPFTVLSLTTKTHTQDGWTKEELTKANTAKNASFLTPEEKDMVMYMNLARMDGARFFDTFFQDFVQAHNQQMRQYGNYDELHVDRGDKYYKSLQKDLQAVRNLPMLYPDEKLSNVARLHGKDLNKNNFVGHQSSDGRSVTQRIGKLYPKRSSGECLAFGFTSGLANVCMLLLDKGVPDLGHRKIILSSSFGFNTVGLSIQPHKTYRYAAVIDFVSLPE